jgi:hypothetical protein
MSTNDYCHHVQQLANALTDCDTPVGDRSLVHQLIRCLNPKFCVLKTLLQLLPRFPSFIEARELLLHEEVTRDAGARRSAETALLTAGGTPPKADNNTAPPPPPDCSNNNNFFGGHGRGGCGGRGRGHGGRNNGHNNGGCATTPSPTLSRIGPLQHPGAVYGTLHGPVPLVQAFSVHTLH